MSEARKAASSASAAGQSASTPSQESSLFDLFYEEFLTQLLNTGQLAESVPENFSKQQTDIDRVEYLMQVMRIECVLAGTFPGSKCDEIAKCQWGD